MKNKLRICIDLSDKYLDRDILYSRQWLKAPDNAWRKYSHFKGYKEFSLEEKLQLKVKTSYAPPSLYVDFYDAIEYSLYEDELLAIKDLMDQCRRDPNLEVFLLSPVPFPSYTDAMLKNYIASTHRTTTPILM